MAKPDQKPGVTSPSALAEGIDRLRLELVALSASPSRDKTVLVPRGRGIFSVERQSISFLSLSKVGRAR